MKQSILIPLSKKPKAQKCTELRIISLMSHILKLLLKFTRQRESIFNLRKICEKILEVHQDAYIGIARIEGGLTSEFKIKKGVRQGWALSSSLFNLYTEQNLEKEGL